MRVWAILMIVLIAGCSISESQAEGIARTFVSKQVKFFATDTQNNTNLPEVDIKVISIAKVGPDWDVKINASSSDGKSAVMDILVGPDGQIKTVNGQPVEKVN